MPVYDHVHSQICGIFYPITNLLLQIFLISSGTITIIFRGIHGQTHCIDSPVIPQCFKRRFVHIRRSHVPVDPMAADTTKLKLLSFCIYQIHAFYAQTAMCRYRSLSCRNYDPLTKQNAYCQQTYFKITFFTFTFFPVLSLNTIFPVSIFFIILQCLLLFCIE